MKNKYFGDVRDLFKYDLAQRIIENIPEIKNFLFVPMITADDGKKEGNKIAYNRAKAGKLNTPLIKFLAEKVKTGKRNVSEIETYFKKEKIPTVVIKEEFTDEVRSRYFDKVEKKLKKNSLILLDPDNGLETLHPNEKHVHFSEVHFIYRIMNTGSVIMIFQYFSREDRKKFIQKKIQELEAKFKKTPLYISDNEITFFFIAKDKKLMTALKNVLIAYNEDYKKLIRDFSKITDSQLSLSF